MALPAYSIVIAENGTATAYTTKAAAEAAFNALTITSGERAFLFLNAQPDKERVGFTWGGTWTDAYGVVRVVGTGEEYVPE